MSFNCSVSYQNATKKVTCPKTVTVNHLVSLSLEKFKLPPDTRGVLLSGGKKLDGLLPLRLTNLVNNARLTLETVSAAGSSATLKVAATVNLETISKIVKMETNQTVADLLSKFMQEAGKSDDWRDQSVQLSVFQSSINNDSTDFSTTTIGSLIGSASNAVLRVVIESSSNRKQREELHEEQRLARQRMQEEKRRARLQAKQEAELRPPQEAESTARAHETEVNEAKNEAEVTRLPEEVPGLVQRESDLGNSLQDLRAERVKQQNPEHTEGRQLVAEQEISTAEGRRELSTENWQMPVEHEDTLYVPQERAQIYDNPEDDYNLTTAQAERYFNMIRGMQTNRKTKKEAVVPQKYTIRVRFPDRALLDLHLENLNVKLGQFLKKLDTYIHANHINTYKLRTGQPPFEEVAVGFVANDTLLKDHPQFQLEKLLLIWESTQSNARGPFVKDGLVPKDVSELPTVVLENNRAHLEDDLAPRSTPMNRASVPANRETPKTKGLPKWFRG